MIYDIINELNDNNSTNYKIEVLKKHKDNKLLQRVLKMTYDKAIYSYGITMKNVVYTPEENYLEDDFSLEDFLNDIESLFVTRELTGNEAIDRLSLTLSTLSKDDAIVAERVIGRDLKVNIGKTQINKVWKDLIVKPAYNRCDIYGEKTKENISFPAIVQIKADGTYREFLVENGNVQCSSRSGETYEYPLLESNFSNFPNNVYTGELTVVLDDELLARILPDLEKSDKKNDTNNVEIITNAYNEAKNKKIPYILPRALGNGLINSDNPPHSNIIIELWDAIPLEEYKIASLKDRKNPCTIPYIKRWESLCEILNQTHKSENIKLITSVTVNNLKEATDLTSKWMQEGLEGAILKDFNMVYKDGTNKQQLKLKIAFSLDVRITGFIEGTPGTSREKTFASLTFITDDNMIQGSVSGFTDKVLEEVNSNREFYIGKIIEIEGNDLTKGRENNYYAVSHPRPVEFRFDKNTTDDLERALDSLEMAKLFKDR